MIPLWSVPSSSSRSERIIPRDTSPRSFASRSGPSAPGRIAPGSATATVAPAPKFQAPHTICRGSPSPTSTRHSWSRSAFGCFPASTTRPTRKRPRLPSVSGTPRRSIRSTSQLETASRAASSASGTLKSTYSRSQETGTLISELAQEADVVLPQQPDVRQPVAEQRDPLEPEPEREARHLLGVVAVGADELVQLRVDHPRAAHLDPAGVLAHGAAAPVAEEARDVRLDRRLGEGEEVRAEADGAVGPEERAHEREQRPLQVGERDPAVDGEPLDLVEGRRVRRVDRVAAVDAAGRDHVDGRVAPLHRPHLRRRGL